MAHLIKPIGTIKDGKTMLPPPLTEVVVAETMAIKMIDTRKIVKDLMKEMIGHNFLVIMMNKEEDSKEITAIELHFNLHHHLVIEEMKKEVRVEKDSNILPEIISGKKAALKEVDTEMIASVEEMKEKKVVVVTIIVVISNTMGPLIPSKEAVLEEVSE